MIDGHIHIERGSYSLEWINEFVKIALEQGLTEIHLLEHSHRFREFAGAYKSVSNFNDYQRSWLDSKMILSLCNYKAFIVEMKQVKFPIDVKFGLEVCYLEETENEIRKTISDFNWDFLTGSVHWIDGWGFDHKKDFWENRNVESLYKRYYEIMENLIKSKLFNTVAHPDSIKCFGYYSKYDLNPAYTRIADLLNDYGMSAEQSAGLHINYGCEQLGMNPRMLGIFRRKRVHLITASDAHCPADVGRCIRMMEKVVNNS